jgi:CHAT domain-containing protein/tetratricopeptide (TPR) repeat protein
MTLTAQLLRRYAYGMLWTAAAAVPILAQVSPPVPDALTLGRAAVARARRAFDDRQGEALRLTWRAALVRNPTHRPTRLGLGHLEYLLSRFVSADSLLKGLIDEPLPPDAITTQAWLGRAFVAGQQGQFTVADSFATVALTLARRSSDSLGVGGALVQIAQYRLRSAGAGAALSALIVADSFVSTKGPVVAATVSCVRAQIRISVSDTLAYADALRGLSLLQPGTEPRLHGGCYLALGRHFYGRGTSFVDSTARYLRLAAAEDQKLGALPGVAAALESLGGAYADAGRYSAALRTYTEALAVAERSRNFSSRNWTLLGLGQLFLNLGDEVKGVPYLIRASTNFREQRDYFGYSFAQLSLFEIRLRRGDTLGVAAAWPETEATLRRLGDRLSRQRSLLVQVSLARTRGDRVGARALAEQLWTQFESDKQGAGDTYTLLRGVTALEAGALDDAETFFVVPARKERGSMREYVLCARLAEIAAKRGNLERAERHLHDAHLAFSEFRATLTDPELRQTVFRANSLDQVDPDLGVATVIHALATGGRAPSSFGLAAERRARELTDALLRASALAEGNRSKGLARARAAEVLNSEASVRAVLGPAEAMLFYVTGERREATTVFVLTRQRVAAATVMSADSLMPLVSRLRRLLEEGQGSEVLRRQLGTSVLGPALPLLPSGITRLLIVGDGPIQGLPFDVLRLPDGSTLLEKYDVALLASPAVLPILRARERPTRTGTLALAVEQPGRPSPLNGRMMPALRRANSEARSATQQQRGSEVLLGSAAREALLYTRTDAVATLHIAAHAVIDPVIESRSAIMLASGDGQDGDMHAWEMDDLAVSAGLVVLSACRTSQADGGRSEGLRGFTAPLLLGGAQAVVATQWDLSDRAASEIMSEFHRQLNSGADAGAALVAAKRKLLQRGRPPSEWAVFQLIGDPGYRVSVPR